MNGTLAGFPLPPRPRLPHPGSKHGYHAVTVTNREKPYKIYQKIKLFFKFIWIWCGYRGLPFTVPHGKRGNRDNHVVYRGKGNPDPGASPFTIAGKFPMRSFPSA